MDSQSPVEQFNDLLSQSSFLFVVYYRGHWCPFCQSYLRTLSTLSPAISSLGGNTLIITSELASFLAETRAATSYTGDAISDPENTLVGYLKEKYGLEIAISEKKGYVNGMAQPGVLVVRGGAANGTGGMENEVLEKWAIVPSAMNLGGAKDRPELGEIWDNVKAKLEGRERVHGKYTTTGFLKMVWRKIVG